jgi:hypothetical protein
MANIARSRISNGAPSGCIDRDQTLRKNRHYVLHRCIASSLMNLISGSDLVQSWTVRQSESNAGLSFARLRSPFQFTLNKFPFRLARWFSTVRWLIPRSAAMFLLGWPAKLFAIHEAAEKRLAGLTDREYQIVKLVLASRRVLHTEPVRAISEPCGQILAVSGCATQPATGIRRS